MLVNPGLEPPWKASLVSPAKPVLKFFAGSLDGGRVFEATVKVLPEALNWLFCDGWDGGSSQ